MSAGILNAPIVQYIGFTDNLQITSLPNGPNPEADTVFTVDVDRFNKVGVQR